MSLIEHDLFRKFWELNFPQVAFVVVVAGPVILWIIEALRAHFNDNRPPWGLAIFRWTTVWAGDPFLAAALQTTAVYYEKVRMDPSFWTSREFSLATIVAGFALSAGFIALEETTNYYPPDLKWNPNRVYHFFFFAVMAGMLLGAIRLVGYGIIGGTERGLALLALAWVALYFVTFYIDAADKSPIWHGIRGAYPAETWRP